MTDPKKPEPPRQSWDALQNRGSTVRPAGSTDGEDEIVMVAVTGAAGSRLMEWLRKTYIDHHCRPAASEAELREADACRRLVHRLEDMRDRALERKRRD